MKLFIGQRVAVGSEDRWLVANVDELQSARTNLEDVQDGDIVIVRVGTRSRPVQAKNIVIGLCRESLASWTPEHTEGIRRYARSSLMFGWMPSRNGLECVVGKLPIIPEEVCRQLAESTSVRYDYWISEWGTGK